MRVVPRKGVGGLLSAGELALPPVMVPQLIIVLSLFSVGYSAHLVSNQDEKQNMFFSLIRFGFSLISREKRRIKRRNVRAEKEGRDMREESEGMRGP